MAVVLEPCFGVREILGPRRDAQVRVEGLRQDLEHDVVDHELLHVVEAFGALVVGGAELVEKLGDAAFEGLEDAVYVGGLHMIW